MDPEEETGSAAQNQNLHDLQNYLVTFKNEIESSEDVLPNMDVDGGDDNDLYPGSGTHLQDPADGEVSSQFNSGIYSEQGMLCTTLTDESTQHQIQNLVSSTENGVDSDINSVKDEVNTDDLEGVQAQIARYGDSQLNQAMPEIHTRSAHQGIIMTSIGDGLDPSNGKMIQIVALEGGDGQYLTLSDGQEMQILNSEDLGLSSESLDQIGNSVDLNSSSTATAISNSTPQMPLVSVSGNIGDIQSNCIDIMSTDTKDGISTGQISATASTSASLFNPGLASLVALPGSGDGAQPQLFALHNSGITTEPLQMASLLGTESMGNQELGCQTITVVPSDVSQSGEMNYVLILTQPDGSKDGVASMAHICELKQESTEITDTIIDENGETKNILRIVPKKLVSEMNNQQLVCDYCNYTSPKRYLLTRHMKSHSEERPFKCEACSRGFKTPASLLNHVNTHTGIRPHKCKTCEAAFTTSGELVRHIRYRHTFEKPHRCPECDYASVELSKLKRHMRSHTGERPYKCPSCPYASPDTYKLKRHMRIHTGEKPYECDICHARFTQSNSLKAHKLIHTGNKPVYQCSLCPTTCGRKTDLKIHFNKLHALGSPLDCKKCGKAFSDRYSYKQHVRSHDMDKCFKCDQCDFVAATEKNLELHMSIHGKKYDCDECHLSFILKHLLDKHKAMFHTKEPSSSSVEEKGKEENDGNSFVTVLGRYDLPDIHSESEESSHLLATPSASDTLHKNLMQDIKEGKLGDVPQVVIVHPDGSQEEISSKLTGDKWSIEELFSTATNNGQTRCEEQDKEMEESKEKEGEVNLPPSEDTSNSSGTLSHPLLESTVDDAQAAMMIAEESRPQNSCFTHSEVSQLCEASTQAEIESDTDSSGESPSQEMLNLSHTMQSSASKESYGVKESAQVSKSVTSAVKTSSTSSTSTTLPLLSSMPSALPSSTIINQTAQLGMPSDVTVSTISNSYLKSLIQKPLVLKAPASTSSTPSSLLASSTSTKKLTSVLQFPKKLNLTSSSVKSGPPGQQYSLLKNLHLKSSASSTSSSSSSTSSSSSSSSSTSLASSLLMTTSNNAHTTMSKDSVVKLFVNFGTPGSDTNNSNNVVQDNSSISSQIVSNVTTLNHPSLSTNETRNSHIKPMSSGTNVVHSDVVLPQEQNKEEKKQIKTERTNLLFMDVAEERQTPLNVNRMMSCNTSTNPNNQANSCLLSIASNPKSRTTTTLPCDKRLTASSSILSSQILPDVKMNPTQMVTVTKRSRSTNNLNPQFSTMLLSEGKLKDKSTSILKIENCDNNEKMCLSTVKSEEFISAAQSGTIVDPAAEQKLVNYLPNSFSLISNSNKIEQPEGLSSDEGMKVINQRQAELYQEVKATVAPKKSKAIKRHNNVDQSLVMKGKRVRKALVKVSL